MVRKAVLNQCYLMLTVPHEESPGIQVENSEVADLFSDSSKGLNLFFLNSSGNFPRQIYPL